MELGPTLTAKTVEIQYTVHKKIIKLKQSIPYYCFHHVHSQQILSILVLHAINALY